MPRSAGSGSGPADATQLGQRGLVLDACRTRDQLEAFARDVAGRSEALWHICTELLTGRDPAAVVQMIADHACELTAADCSVVAVAAGPDSAPDDVDRLVVTAVSGADADSVVGDEIPLGSSNSGSPLRIDTPHRSDHLGCVLDTRDKEFGPALLVPLRAGDAGAGVLMAVRRQHRRPFDAAQLALATTLADQASHAMTVAATQRRTQTLSLSADRDRIARDLHDHVIQRLFAIGLSLHGTLQTVDSPALRTRIDAVIDELQAAVGDIRAAVFDLRAGGAGGQSWPERLHRLVLDSTCGSSIRAELHVEGCVDDVDPVVAGHAEAVVREAMSNAFRHSGGSCVRVVVRASDRLTVEVRDDGCGFSEASERRGLANLAARADEVGGSFEIDSVAGAGTTVRWSAPFQVRAGREEMVP